MSNQNEKGEDLRKNNEIKVGDKVYYLNEKNEETIGIINGIGYIINKKIYLRTQITKEEGILKKETLIRQINDVKNYLNNLEKQLEEINDKENKELYNKD